MFGSGMVQNPKRVVWSVRCVPIVESGSGSRLPIETLWRRRKQAFMSAFAKARERRSDREIPIKAVDGWP